MEVGYVDHMHLLCFGDTPWVEQEGPEYWEHETKRAKSIDFPRGREDPVWLLQLSTMLLDFHPVSGSAWTIASPSVFLSFSPGHPVLFSHLSLQLPEFTF